MPHWTPWTGWRPFLWLDLFALEVLGFTPWPFVPSRWWLFPMQWASMHIQPAAAMGWYGHYGDTYCGCCDSKSSIRWRTIKPIDHFGTLDSGEMRSEGLQDEGATEGSLEFLWNVWKASEMKLSNRCIYLGVITIHLVVEKTEMLEVLGCKFLAILIRILQVRICVAKGEDNSDHCRSYGAAPRVRNTLHGLQCKCFYNS